MLFSKKAVSLAIYQIVGIVLALLVLGFAIWPIIQNSGKVDEITACKINGGDLIKEECNTRYSTPFVLGDTREGNCCKQKATVTNETYQEWLETRELVKVDTTRDDPNEIPVIGSGSGRAENIVLDSNTKLAEGEARLSFNGKTTDEEEGLFTVGNKGERAITIVATHNHADGDYCHLYIVEAEPSGSAWQPKEVNGVVVPWGSYSYKLNNCAPEENEIKQLQIVDTISQAGYYQAYYIVKEDETGATLVSKKLTFRVVEQFFSGDVRRPSITFWKSSDMRGTDRYCWGQIVVETHGEALEEPEISVDIVDGTCGRASYEPYSFGSSPEPLSENQHFCVLITQSYVNEFGVNSTLPIEEHFDGEECTYAQLLLNQEAETCSQTCSDYTGSESCTDYERREDACKYSLDCYTRGRQERSCEKCNVIDCSGYKNQASCESNQCLDNQACEWQDNFLNIGFLERCVPYSGEE